MDISLNSNVTYDKFDRGEVLFKEGAKVDRGFIIVSGKVALVKKVDKRESIFYIATDKDIIGEDCILSSEQVHYYSAVALEEVEVIPLAAPEITAVIDSHNDWISNILSNISRKVYNSIEMISEHRIEDDELYNSHQLIDDDLVMIKSALAN
jgi:CRP-like cAMP-binding protein